MTTSAGQPQLNWRAPLYIVAASALLLLSLMLYNADADLLYLLIVAPIMGLCCVCLLVVAIVRRRSRQFISVLITLAGFVAVSYGLLRYESLLRPSLRWLLFSRRYKAELMAGPSSTGELRHMEWDSWGLGPVGSNSVYLVFDPANSLASAAQAHSPGRLAGIPCEALLVRRLENQWYSVRFYTDESWSECPFSNKEVR